MLFAIVLGLAALVASLSRPLEQRGDDSKSAARGEPRRPNAVPRPAPELPAAISFDAGQNEAVRLREGRAATVQVSVGEPGSVEILEMGLSAPADALTPARFDVFAARAGRYELVFTPADGDSVQPAGRLVVTSDG